MKYLYYSFSLCFLFLVSCTSYHEKSASYQSALNNGQYNLADKEIEKNKFLKKKRNQLLYYMEKGTVAHDLHQYKKSNEYFNKADYAIEDYQKNVGEEALALLTNPETKDFVPEDFEKVMIHYYKALNYTFLNQPDEAIVELKRLNLQLQQINDKYPAGKKNRYTTDAFALNFQGMLYESTGNINDAFISYRNAVELYEKNGGTYFGVKLPEQLKKDVIRTAHILGFTEEALKYEKKFNLRYEKPQNTGGELIIFWDNGLVPYKDQTFINFSFVKGQGGVVSIVNEDFDLILPVPLPDNNRSGRFSDFETFNMAIPKYVERKPVYTSGNAEEGLHNYTFEKAEDFNVIAFQTLKDRMLREIGKAALRLAVKKTTEYTVRNQNRDIGAVLGIFNALTEKADTRNWQSLPNSIYYVRIPLQKGMNTIKVNVKGRNGENLTETYQIDGNKQVQFLDFTTSKSYSTQQQRHNY
ncbi:COG3014 family protein [Aureivirga marina]|uniref:COG3014 family protein n=1 Tax=Aureivirga marina TaxID=1182451 RepID=UPI0018CB583B|nr:hypothetical protein [Aureivirga marina]